MISTVILSLGPIEGTESLLRDKCGKGENYIIEGQRLAWMRQ